MAANDTHITRITRALGSVTSIFRCHGLQYIPPNADSLGGHDLFYWAAFLTLLSGWFLFLYMPQCRRLERLTGQQQALVLQLGSDKKELARLQLGISSLNKGDALAWERAARERFGWLEPGEVLDVDKWRRTRAADNATLYGGAPNVPARNTPNSGQPILPRPRVPQIPQPSHVPSALAANSAHFPRFADAGSLGPVSAHPPAPPPAPTLPVLPQRQVHYAPVAPAAPLVRRDAGAQPVTYRSVIR